MNKLILNRVAIWRPKLNDEFSVRKSPAGRIYYENNVAHTSDEELYRYAKNYTIGKGKSAPKICLLMVTASTSEKQIEEFLDDTSKKIDPAFAQQIVLASNPMSFDYTDFNYKEKK